MLDYDVSEAEWFEKYKIHTDLDGAPRLYETYGEDILFVQENYKKAWTLIDADQEVPAGHSGTFTVSGMMAVNRIGYYVGDVEFETEGLVVED